MKFQIDDIALCDIETCAAFACDSEIGRKYGFERAALGQRIRDALAAGAIVVTARGSEGIAGFAWIEPRGAFGAAPYLKLIAVDSGLRGAGAGAALMDAFEERTKSMGRAWTLLVSEFNERAIAFYEKHGYTKVGTLPEFARPGLNEILMMKKKP